MKTAQLRKLHKRLMKGEHLLVVNYGMLKRDIFSIWYAEDDKGRYIRLLGQNGAELINPHFWLIMKTDAYDFRDGEDIRNYKAHNTEVRFLEAERFEVVEDKLNQTQRKIKDYTELLAMTVPEYKLKEPYASYQLELDRLAA